ncbi:MAG: hypothetical protein GEU26_12005 [Nitrososphaeraceae archaeon]|nr:hypothetical protein [Nitrososphaeraceae archaeon]
MASTWLQLNKAKRIAFETMRERITREDFEKSSRLPTDETIKKMIKEDGFYDIKMRLSVEETKVLDILVDLGYVDRYQDKIHKAYFGYRAIPYILDTYPSGEISLRSNVKEINEIIDLHSDQYQRFYNSGKRLSSQIKDGMHDHIQCFYFGEKFHYETTIYELKDKYFDSVSLEPVKREERIKVFLTEPVVQSQNRRKIKNWKYIKEISLQDFLSDRQKVDELIDNELEWKKSKDGILIHRNYDYNYNLLIAQDQNTPPRRSSGLSYVIRFLGRK